MSKLEYLNPSDWSLHVIDGENEGVPEGWVWVPEDAESLYKFNDKIEFYKNGYAYCYPVDGGEWIKRGYAIHSSIPCVWTRKMKEYLVERDGKYELVEAYHLDGGIEVPEGAEVYFKFRDSNRFLTFKENLAFSFTGFGYMLHDLTKIGIMENKDRILWQRKPLLNDQCAEIEEVNQVELKDVRARADIFCKETSKHRHYFKNVQNLNMIDIYRVLELFDVQSHAVGHAVKKLLCSGGRGSKDYLQDVQEAIDSLQREIEMKREDSK